MPKISVKKDIKKDAWNWWHACNKVSYNVDWKQRIDKKISGRVTGQSKKEAFEFLVPYLEDLYQKIDIYKILKEVEDTFQKKEGVVFKRMEQVCGKRIYRGEFTCFLTTFPRAPYDYEKGYIWIPIVWPRETYVRTFIHELLHFQTYAYWEKRCLEQLTKVEFENLKEALTVVLNEEFMDIMTWGDKGYAKHEKLRKELLKHWKKTRDFGELVRYAVDMYENCM